MKRNRLEGEMQSAKEKRFILAAILAGFMAGGLLGVVAYYQQWLG